MDVDSTSLINGAVPPAIVGLGLGAVLLSFRWRDAVWVRQLLIGVPVTGVLVGIAALLVDGLALIPYQFPNSYYLWVGLVVLSVVVCAIGWRRSRWRRVVTVLAVVLTTAMAATLINQHYQYYPTVGSLVGVDAQHEVSQRDLEALKKANGGAMPTHGFTVQVRIPGTVSGFQPRDAFVWLPPAWLAGTRALPVIMLLAGVPSEPSDWTRAAFADRTAREFALAHEGLAPIIVMPDAYGSSSTDTECVNSPLGQAETYLTIDVPTFVRQTYAASRAPGSMAVGGLSAGGFCATMLALRHPDVFPTFANYSGLASPTVAEGPAPALTTQQLFGGSSAAYDAHNPVALLAASRYPTLGGWFEVGSSDSAPLAAQRQLVPLARNAGITTCSDVISGGHDFDVWAQSFQDSLPWLSARLGLTPPPTPAPAACQ